MSGYAVVEIGGKQHRISPGEKLLVDLMADKQSGDELNIDKVLMLGGDEYKIGTPYVAGASVSCKVSNMGQDGEGIKGGKVRVFKKKRRTGFTKTQGHRQRYSELTINQINF